MSAQLVRLQEFVWSEAGYHQMRVDKRIQDSLVLSCNTVHRRSTAVSLETYPMQFVYATCVHVDGEIF